VPEADTTEGTTSVGEEEVVLDGQITTFADDFTDGEGQQEKREPTTLEERQKTQVNPFMHKQSTIVK
jgi:hypothetical protein